MIQSEHLRQDYKKFMSTKLTPDTFVCLTCLGVIDPDVGLDSLNYNEEGKLVKDTLKSLSNFVTCTNCKMKFHEECFPKASLSSSKLKRPSSKNLECENCAYGTLELKFCLICKNQTGCLKFITKIGTRSYFGHFICLYFSSNFFMTGRRLHEFSPTNFEVLDSYSKDYPTSFLCQICLKAINPFDSYFECYCDFKCHMYCGLYCRAVGTSEKLSKFVDAQKTPILFLNEYKTIENRNSQISFESALSTLSEVYLEKMFLRHPREFYQEKLSKKLDEFDISLRKYHFKMYCGSCTDSKSQFCCNKPGDGDFIMCCICCNWIHKLDECTALNSHDLDSFKIVQRETKTGTVGITNNGRHSHGANASKRRNGKSDRRGKPQIEEESDQGFFLGSNDSFFNCNKCFSSAIFIKNIEKDSQLRLLPNNLVVLQFLNRFIRDYIIKNSKDSEKLVKRFKENLILRLEDLSIKQFLKNALENVQYSNEIEVFETDFANLLRKGKYKFEEFDSIKNYFIQKVKPLSKEKEKKTDLTISISFYDELFAILNGYWELDIEQGTRKVESKLKRLTRNYRYNNKRTVLRAFIKFINDNFLEAFDLLLKNIEPLFLNVNCKINVLFDKWLNKSSLQYSDILEFLEKKVNDSEIQEKTRQMTRSILGDKFKKSFCLSPELVKFLSNFKITDVYQFDELREKFGQLVSCKTFDLQYILSTKAFLEKYFLVINSKKEFDKMKCKLQALTNFNPKTFLDNLSNMNFLSTFDDLNKLKTSEFKEILYDSFFNETEKRSFQKSSELTNKMNHYNETRANKICKYIKEILSIVFREQIVINKEIYNFLLSGVDQYKIQKFLKRRESPFTLKELISLKESVNPENCNKFFHRLFVSMIEKAQILENEISESLKNENFFSNKIAIKIADFNSRATELNYKNVLLHNYKINCEFIELINYLKNQELHVDYSLIEEYNLANFDKFIDEDISFDNLEQLKAFKIEKFVFRDVEHLYKKAVSKYYDNLVKLCSSGTKNLKVSWIKDDLQLRNYFSDASKFPFENYLKSFKEMENDIISLLKNFSKDDEILANLSTYIHKIDEIFEKSEKFDIDNQGLKADLNFLFDLKFHLFLLWNIQWFLSVTQSSLAATNETNNLTFVEEFQNPDAKAEIKIPLLNPYETPRRISNENMNVKQLQISNNTESFFDKTISFLYSAFLKNNTNDVLLASNSSQIEAKKQSDKTFPVFSTNEEENKAISDLVDKCRLTYEFLITCSKFFIQTNDLKIEHLIKEFKENYGNFLQVKTDHAEIVRKIQRSQIDPLNMELKIEGKDLQKMIPKMSKFKYFFREQISLVKNSFAEFNTCFSVLKKDAEELIKKPFDDLLKDQSHIANLVQRCSNSFIKSSQSEIYFSFFSQILKILNCNGKKLSKVKSKFDKFLNFMKLNFNLQSEFSLVSSINSKLAEISEVKEILDQLQQNESSDEAFRIQFQILRDYTRTTGFKVSFNYDSYEDFEQEVRTISYLVDNNFVDYFSSLKNKKSKINPSDLLRMKIEDKQSKIGLVNAFFSNQANPKTSDSDIITSLYFFVRENTGRTCYGYDPIIEYKFNLVEQERRELEINFSYFDKEIQTLISEFNKILIGELSPSNFSLSPYENLEFSKLDINKSYVKPQEKLFYRFKLFVLNMMKQLIFTKTNKKLWMLKDVFKREDLCSLVDKFKKAIEAQYQTSSNSLPIFSQCHTQLANIIRYICFLTNDKDKKMLREKLPKSFADLVDQFDIKAEQNFINFTQIVTNEEFSKLGPNNLCPAISFIFHRINENVISKSRSEFNRLLKLVSQNQKPNNEFLTTYQSLLDRFLKNPFITKNETTTLQIESLCIKLSKAIEENKNKTGGIAGLIDNKKCPDKKTNEQFDQSEHNFIIEGQKNQHQNKNKNLEEFSSKFKIQNENHIETSIGPHNHLYSKVFKFVRDLFKKSALCKQLEKKNFEIEEFWALQKSPDILHKVFESPSSGNDPGKSEVFIDSLIKKEEILKSNSSNFNNYRQFLQNSNEKSKTYHTELNDHFFRNHCDYKKIKETSLRSPADNYFEFIDVRIFKLNMGDVFLEKEKLNLTFLTSKNPLFYPYILKTQIYIKFDTKLEFEAFSKIISLKIDDFISMKSSKPFMAGWLHSQSLRQNCNFYNSLMSLDQNVFIRERFLFDTQYFELFIGRYSALDAKMIQFINYLPLYSEKTVEIKDLFVFFFTNDKAAGSFYEQECKENFEIFEKYSSTQGEDFECLDSLVLHRAIETSQDLLLSHFIAEL